MTLMFRTPARAARSALWSGIAVAAIALATTSAIASSVSRERDIVNLRLGQRVLVDDGTCPVGQIKEVMGAKLSPSGVVATRKCVSRTNDH
jgi:hypothetical protein